MGNELEWLLKEGGGRIFESCDISLENTPTSHRVSLALLCTLAVILQCLFCHALGYAITANGVCLHLLAPPLAQCCPLTARSTPKIGAGALREKHPLQQLPSKRGGGTFEGEAIFGRLRQWP